MAVDVKNGPGGRGSNAVEICTPLAPNATSLLGLVRKRAKNVFGDLSYLTTRVLRRAHRMPGTTQLSTLKRHVFTGPSWPLDESKRTFGNAAGAQLEVHGTPKDLDGAREMAGKDK